MSPWILLLPVFLALLTVVLVHWRLRKRRLPRAAAERFLRQWDGLSRIADPGRRVLEAEAILDAAMRQSGCPGTFAEKLKRVGARFPDVDAVWSAHRLRNRIAHEAGTRVSDADARRALAAFEKALRSLL